MKKLITILIAGLLTLASYGQSGVIRATGIQLGTGTGATTAYNLVSTAEYTIQKVGSTYYARPGIGTGLTAYSGALPTPVVQSAATALTNGGTIFMKAGLYDNWDSLAITHDNITIKSDGLAILKLKANKDIHRTSAMGMIWLLDAEHTIISGLQLDGNKANQTIPWESTNVNARVCGIQGYWGNSYPNYTLIENCYIHDFTQFGLIMESSNGSIIRDCRLEYNDENNFTIGPLCTNTTIERCTLIGSHSVSGTIYGNTVNANNTVRDCTVGNIDYSADGSGWGLAMEGDNGTGVYNCSLIHNTITGTNIKTAIYLHSLTKNCVIADNIVDHIGGTGITVVLDSGSLVINNRITRWAANYYGIVIYGSTRMQISNNYVASATGMGLSFNVSSGVYSTYNVASNNFLNTPSHYAVQIGTGDNYNVFMNNVISNLAGGEYLWGWDQTVAPIGTIWSNNYNMTGGVFQMLAGGTTNTVGVITKKFIIGGVGVTKCDFNFATAANVTEQVINLGAIVPSGARIVNVSTYTTAVFTGATTLVAETGSASSGAQFIASASIYATDAITATAAGGVFIAAPLSTATTVYVSATPGANWSGVTAGKMTVYVTYIPYN